jgi:hypothetical protein
MSRRILLFCCGLAFVVAQGSGDLHGSRTQRRIHPLPLRDIRATRGSV